MKNLHIDSSLKELDQHTKIQTDLNSNIDVSNIKSTVQDITMQTVLNTNIDVSSIKSTDQVLNLCLRCKNYVMTNRFNISFIVSNHKCVVISATHSAENLASCMHKTIDAIANFEANLTKNTVQEPPLSSFPVATPFLPESMLHLSSIVSDSHEILMTSADSPNDTNLNSHHQFMTSTPKTAIQSKNYARYSLMILFHCLVF